MASFDNSNDIKIQISLDTDAALQAAQELKAAIEGSIKATADQFKQLQQITKQLQANLKAQTKQVTAETKQQLDAGIKNATDAANKEVAIADKAAKEKVRIADRARKAELEAQKNKIRELEALVRQESQRLSTERTKSLERIAELNLQRTIAKKAPKAEFSPELGGIASSGKLVEAFKNSIAGLSLQFGNVNVGFGAFIENFKNLGIVGGAIAGIAAAIGTIQRLDQQIDQLAERAGRLEGLKTGFETLQRTIAQDPTASIQKLREATQGLISDVDLYQRANQAVLLGVPTETFNEAAAAAVKLGRAMGIDAAFGLESLSLGLGRQSRLYLDNLGIVVSAEEAYQNFAATVNKSATDLTDAEKKAAFFAEALKKIKERADELPDPLDTVGVLLQKLAAAQVNASEKFSEGINKSSELATAYREQIAIQQRAVESSQRFGEVVAKVAAPIKGLANDLRLLAVIGKEALIGLFDIFTDIGPEENLATAQKNVEKLKEALGVLYQEKERTAGGSARLNSNIKVLENALKLAEAQVAQFTLDLKKLRGEVEEPFKFKVDLSGIKTAQDSIAVLFRDLQREAEAQAGVFRVAGLPDEEAAQIFQKYKAAKDEFDKSLKDNTALDKFRSSIAQLQAEVTGAPIKNTTEELAQETTKLLAALGSGNFAKAKESLNAVGGAIKKVATSVKSSGLALEDLKRGFSGITKETTKTTKGVSKFGKTLEDELKDIRKEFEKFGRKTRQSFEEAIPTNIQKELLDIFRTTNITTAQFSQSIADLAVKAKVSGGDLDKLKEIIADLQDQIKKGVKPIDLKINAGGTGDPVKQVKDTVVNIRKALQGIGLNVGEEGGFFGFDASGIFGKADQAALAESIQSSIASGLQSITGSLLSKDYEQAAEDIGATIGAVAGAAIEAAFFGTVTGIGAALGSIIGAEIGKAIFAASGDGPGTRERKNIDGYFAELFDGDRLAVILEAGLITGLDKATGEFIRTAEPTFKKISDLVFEGFTPFAGQVDFGGDNFTSFFNTLSVDVQAAFNGIGLAFGKLNGIATEEARLIGIAIANNIGGSLQNLQLLIQATGESFENLSNAVINAFLDGQLTIEETANSLGKLRQLFETGIPGAVGATEEAFKNFEQAINLAKPGRIAVDAFRDVAAEASEAGLSFQQTADGLARAYGLSAQQAQLFYQLLKQAGITSLQELEKASNEKIISILNGARLIREGIAQTTEDVAKIPIIPDVAAPQVTQAPRAPSGKSEADKRKERAKQFREEVQRLLRESQTYLDIVNKIAAAEISRAAGGAQIIALQRQIADALKERNSLESQYAKELARGAKANTDRLGRLAAALDAVNKKIDGFTKKATEGFKALDISGIIPLIKSANSLGVVARITGVDLEKVTDILVQGFLRGKLTLEQFNEQLKKTQDNLGKGIPNEIGAVTKAFQNLVDAGVQGGAFSVDAFTDIFAEFREKFQQQSSVVREQQRKDLIAALENAKAAQRAAVGPEAAQAAQKAVDAAKKALDDFYNTIPSPNLSDLRAELEATFGVEEVAKFFQAIDESGLNSFQDLENAGSEAIVKILARLAELGFNFNQTSDEIQNVNNGLNDAANAASGGLDPLKEAIELVKQFNEGAGSLPPAFNSTTQAIAELNGPLSALATGFDNIIEKLGRLSGNEFRNDVIFNVRTVGDAGSQGLVEILFGDGADASASTGNGAPVSGGSSGGGGGSSSRTRSRDRFVRVGPGRWKNLRTGRVVNSTKNPGR